MEQRIISYTKGITRSPGELIAEDGELLECINLKCEGGELKPLLWPEKAGFALNDGEELLYIHKGSGYKNYFVGVPSGSNLKVTVFSIGEDGTKKSYDFTHTFAGEKVKFESVGNTVVVLDGEGTIHYVLFKSNTYSYLGTKFPECSLSFGLQGEFRTYSQKNDFLEVVHSKAFTINDEGIIVNKDCVSSVTDQILGAVNKFIKEESTDKGKFVFPFFVRYAYRLYDGTLTSHSAPVLMVASSYYNPYVHVRSYGSDKKTFKCDISTVVSRLDYQLVNTSVKTKLTAWSDIIKSVDIFISAPIYVYDQNKKIEKLVNTSTYPEDGTAAKLYEGCYFVGSIVGGDCKGPLFENRINVTGGNLLSKYQRFFIPMLYQFLTCDPVGVFSADLSFGKDLINDRLKDCSTFYYLKSIRPDLLSSGSREVIDISESYLSSLQSREQMTDEYRSHFEKKAANIYIYNNRLNLSNIEITAFKGFFPDSLYQYTNGASKLNVSYYIDDGEIYIYANERSVEDLSRTYCSEINLQIGRENGDISEIIISSYKSYDMREVGLYSYHPDADGSFLIVGSLLNLGDYDFERHKHLNGVYNLQGLDRRLAVAGANFLDAKGDFKELEQNKTYTSEVNNPFVFPASGVNTIGTGDIIGIVSTTKALSQGQFGQFPLLVLSTDGIWAMTVNDEGLYSTKQALSRDVCNNADSIVQTDNLVFFSSERGLMAIDGANVVCVTAHMKGLPQKPNDLKRMADILKSVGGSLLDAVNVCGNEEDFISYLRGSKMGYNYRDNSLYIANGAYKYVYVYQINNRTLSKLYHDGAVASGFVNDYPDTLMQSGEDVYSLLAEPLLTGDSQHGFAMTRALKLGNPTGLKRIKQVKNMKDVLSSSSYVKYALWGSNDGLRWYYVGSYDGGFKYYRMGLFTKLAPSESVLGSVMAVEEKRNNKMR